MSLKLTGIYRLAGSGLGALVLASILLNQPTITAADAATLPANRLQPADMVMRATTPTPSTPGSQDPPPPKFGAVWVSPKDGMQMVSVPEGSFQMGAKKGAKDEMPQHTVYLDAYWIDRTDVTNAMYANCVAEGGCAALNLNNPNFIGAQQPVVGVDWNTALTYCKWAGRRLPSEAEWEKAARGVDGGAFPWGKVNKANMANFENKVGKTTDVGSFPAGVSPYGALDMAGNVWNWVADWYDRGYYANSTARNPRGADTGTYRVMRGGSWNNTTDLAQSTYRGLSLPTGATYTIGLRCAMTPPSASLVARAKLAQPVADAKLAFQDDFESGSLDKFSDVSGYWQVIDDGTGNKVLATGSSNLEDYARISFGPNDFHNGLIRFRYRYIAHHPEKLGTHGTIYYRKASEHVIEAMQIGNWDRLQMCDINGDWKSIGESRSIQYIKDKWYTYEIDIREGAYQVYVDGKQVVNLKYASKVNQTGGLMFDVWNGNEGFLDDIEVWEYPPGA